jgi:hypothetical protein
VVCYSQYFEGEIIYKNAFTSKIPNVTGEQMGKIMGTTQNYFIKDGNYKSFVDGTSIIMQQFDSKTNRLYNKTNNSDTLFWFDASINTDEVINFEIIKNKEKILGFDCDALVLHTKSGTTTFYYSSKYMVATKYYTNHNYGNWNYFINKSQSLPLKIVVENKQLVMESVAMEIKSMDLGDMYFNIPFTVPIKQSK